MNKSVWRGRLRTEIAEVGFSEGGFGYLGVKRHEKVDFSLVAQGADFV